MDQQAIDQHLEWVMLICLGFIWHRPHPCSKDMVRLFLIYSATTVAVAYDTEACLL